MWRTCGYDERLGVEDVWLQRRAGVRVVTAGVRGVTAGVRSGNLPEQQGGAGRPGGTCLSSGEADDVDGKWVVFWKTHLPYMSSCDGFWMAFGRRLDGFWTCSRRVLGLRVTFGNDLDLTTLRQGEGPHPHLPPGLIPIPKDGSYLCVCVCVCVCNQPRPPPTSLKVEAFVAAWL